MLFLQFHNDDQGIHPYKHHGGKYPLPFRGLLHLTILKILSENSMRGIDVKKRIKEIFGLDVPSAVIYIILKNLEERGLVYSKWDKSEDGSPLKTYSITSEGAEYLKEKVSAIKSIRKILDYLAETSN